MEGIRLLFDSSVTSGCCLAVVQPTVLVLFTTYVAAGKVSPSPCASACGVDSLSKYQAGWELAETSIIYLSEGIPTPRPYFPGLIFFSLSEICSDQQLTHFVATEKCCFYNVLYIHHHGFFKQIVEEIENHSKRENLLVFLWREEKHRFLNQDPPKKIHHHLRSWP